VNYNSPLFIEEIIIMDYIIDDMFAHFSYTVFSGDQYAAFTIFIIIIAAGALFTGTRAVYEKISASLLILYSYAVYSMTVLMRVGSREEPTISWIPFISFIRYNYGSSKMLWLGLLNVVMFIPNGFLTGLLLKRMSRPKRFFIGLVFIILFSLCIEWTQYYLKAGVCEFDDVLFNTAGGLCGLVVTFLFDLSDKNRRYRY
jgi:glycopeptide antibiotics resistance protein